MKQPEPKLVVKAGAQLDDWGTPAHIIVLVRKVCGNKQVSIDLASNRHANEIIRARSYYSLEHPCPASIAPYGGRLIYCNPPGPVANVRWFWDVWVNAMHSSGNGAFLIFNLDHLRSLTPLQKHVCMTFVPLPKRVRYVGAASQYNHPSALVFSGDVRERVRDYDGTMHPMLWVGP